jgi:hypothetical protein
MHLVVLEHWAYLSGSDQDVFSGTSIQEFLWFIGTSGEWFIPEHGCNDPFAP